MSELLVVAAEFTPQVTVRRYIADGTYSTVTCRAKFRRFSSDSKRKTAAYDRVGFALPSSMLDTGEVALAGGDVIVRDPGGASEAIYLVGKLSENDSHVPRLSGLTSYVFDAYFANARVKITRVSDSRNFDSGVYTESRTVLLSSIPASISPAENYESAPFLEVKDHHSMVIPGVFILQEGDIVEILPHVDTDDVFEHPEYRVEYPIEDSSGVKRFRLIRNLATDQTP